jgi:hypothetical protein
MSVHTEFSLMKALGITCGMIAARIALVTAFPAHKALTEETLEKLSGDIAALRGILKSIEFFNREQAVQAIFPTIPGSKNRDIAV